MKKAVAQTKLLIRAREDRSILVGHTGRRAGTGWARTVQRSGVELASEG